MTSPEKPHRLSATGVAVREVLGGKYRIDGQLGSGGMGVVLSATHLELDAPVAIKIVRDEYARNEEVVARMLFEARAAAKLRSSHVVRVLDVARLESGAPYIVMERLEGGDLAKLLVEQGSLQVEEAVDYLLQACDGLVEAHALGIIHRDLKPENLFRASTPEGFVLKVLDFGISKDTGTSMSQGPRSVMTNAGYAVGSPYYMSPEQMRASVQVDARADIWSLGAILYELLSSHCPFEGESLQLVCANVLHEDYAPLRSFAPHVPEGLEAIVDRCLRKDREERFASVSELASALEEFAGADGRRSTYRGLRSTARAPKSDSVGPTPAPFSATLSSSSHAPSAPVRPARRGRWLAAGAVVVLLGSVWALFGSGREQQPSGTDVASPVAAEKRAAQAPRVEAPSAALPEAAPPPSAAPSASVGTARRAPIRVAGKSVSAPSVAPSATPPAVKSAPAPVVASPRPSGGAFDPDRLGGRY